MRRLTMIAGAVALLASRPLIAQHGDSVAAPSPIAPKPVAPEPATPTPAPTTQVQAPPTAPMPSKTPTEAQLQGATRPSLQMPHTDSGGVAPIVIGRDTSGGPGRVAPPLSGQSLEPTPVDGVVAIVGTTPILGSEIEERIAAYRAQGQSIPEDSVERMKMVHDVLGAIVDEELLVQKAQEMKVDVNENDLITSVDQSVAKIRARFTSEQEFRTELKQAGFGTPDEYRHWLIEQQRRQQYQQKLFEQLRQENKLPSVPVTDKEVNDYFEQNKGHIPRLPATVTLRQIVVSPKPSAKEDSVALARAESVWVELKKGGDFEQIAKRESADPGSKDQGGDLGWRRRGDFVPEFDRVYFSLPPGQISPVIRTVFGYHIIKIDRSQPAEVKGRHILIRPQVDSADVQLARGIADSVAKLWRGGMNFDTLVARFHDPSEEKSIPQPFPQSQLPQEYQTAITGHVAGDVLPPFSILDKTRNVPKYFVLQLTSITTEHDPTVADWREKIREQLTQEKAIRRYLDSLRRQTFVAVRL